MVVASASMQAQKSSSLQDSAPVLDWESVNAWMAHTPAMSPSLSRGDITALISSIELLLDISRSPPPIVA